MSLYYVGSVARGEHLKGSDIDFVTTDDLTTIVQYLPKYRIIKLGPKYTQLINNSNVLDIWKVPAKTLQNNIVLRSMDKGHYIGFVTAVRNLGYYMNFNGIKVGSEYISPFTFIKRYPSLHKFKKYLKRKGKRINLENL